MHITRQRIFILIPLLIILALLINMAINSYIHLFSRKTLALLLFIPIARAFFKDLKMTIIATGIYLLLATVSLLIIMPYETTYRYWTIGSVTINLSWLQIPALGVLLLYFLLNYGAMIGYYLDYKEARSNKKRPG